MGFVLYGNERSIFPIEAKVIHTSTAVGEYVNEVKANYLTCRYAPFSREGSMLGYLLQGDVEVVFEGLGTKLDVNLETYEPLFDRNHRLSVHSRTSTPFCDYFPGLFRCHHLIMPIVCTGETNE